MVYNDKTETITTVNLVNLSDQFRNIVDGAEDCYIAINIVLYVYCVTVCQLF